MDPTLLESAIMLNELYVSFIEAGFTEDQAMELTKAVLLSNIGGDDAEVQDS
jgi:hypothetical protein